MLDDLYQEYSDKIDEKFEQTEILIQELIGVVNENQSSISDTITTVTSDVGYTISDQMKTIWNDAGTVISGFTGKFDTYATTVQSAINSIQVTIDNMLQIAQAEANKNIATANNPMVLQMVLVQQHLNHMQLRKHIQTITLLLHKHQRHHRMSEQELMLQVIGIMILMVLLQQAMSTDSNQIILRLIKSLMVVLIHIIFKQLSEVNVLAVMVGLKVIRLAIRMV